eukprot:m.91889 g.91889  ORF g.91889 m.91889 type:complete len:121 (-) comp15054_c0_seq3:29-391(-)
MKRFAFVNPFALPLILPERPEEVAKLALHRIVGRQATLLDLRCDDGFVLAAHLPQQVERLKAEPSTPLRVEGPSYFWLGKQRTAYANLVTDDAAQPGTSGGQQPSSIWRLASTNDIPVLC